MERQDKRHHDQRMERLRKKRLKRRNRRILIAIEVFVLALLIGIAYYLNHYYSIELVQIMGDGLLLVC
ncbi:MAG: hypothetical protein R3Y58_03320 [Eubacteriales bacterium]